MKRFLLIPMLAATTALAGPFDQPYAIITTDSRASADPLLHPVIVNRVDGENAVDHRAIVAPGRRKITVDLPPRKGFHLPTQRTLELQVKPCVRYHLAAKLATSGGQEWRPVVRSEERIGECEAKFKGPGK